MGWLDSVGGAVSGAWNATGNAVGNFLAGEPIGQPPNQSPVDSGSPIGSGYEQPSGRDAENFNVQGTSESGNYVASSDTSAPAQQAFTATVSTPLYESQITRADYTAVKDLGDSKTQALLQQGYSPEQALAMQRDVARDAGNVRATSYYQNEYDKALQSNIALSSEYHSDAQKSGLPQAINPYAHVGDISLMALQKSQGVDNTPGSAWKDQFTGSLLKDANIITKAERTGETGVYGHLPLPYSSALGSLDLTQQQDIGRRAAATGLASGKGGWAVDEHIMDKYKPDVGLGQSEGFGLLYKKAVPSEVKLSSTGENLLSPSYMKKISLVPDSKGNMRPTITGSENANEYLGGTTIVSKPIKSNEGEYNVNIFERLGTGFMDALVPVKKYSGEVYRSQADIAMGTSGVTIGGYNMNVLEGPPGHYGNKPSALQLTQLTGNAAWTSRKPKPTHPRIRRNPIYIINQTLIKPKPTKPKVKPINLIKSVKLISKPKQSPSKIKQDLKSIINIEAINNNVMPKSLGKGFAALISPDKVVKSIGAHTKVKGTGKGVGKVKIDAIGLMNIKNITENINISGFGANLTKGKSGTLGVVGNINTMLTGMLKSKKVKVK